MPKVSSDDESFEVALGEKILDVAEKLGVPFGCTKGNCGTCLTKIIDGMDHLNAPTEKEKQFGVSGNDRLMCQCYLCDGKDDDEVVLDI